MKKKLVIFILLLFALGTLRAQGDEVVLGFTTEAQRQITAREYHATVIDWQPDRFHQFFIWGGAGYSVLLSGVQQASTLGYAGGYAGLGYSFSFDWKWAINTGVEFYSLNSRMKIDRFVLEYEMIDTEQERFRMSYLFANYRERQYTQYVNVPLTVSYRFHPRFYCTLGAKVGVHLRSSYATTTNFETRGKYAPYIDDFKEMPNHSFAIREVESTTPVNFGLNLMATAEVGAYLSQEDNPRWRIAWFVDFGIANMRLSSDEGDLVVYDNDPADIRLRSLLYGQINTGHHVNPLMTGLKITLLIKSKPVPLRYPCECP